MSESEFSDEQAVLEKIVDRLGLPAAESRLLTGQDNPDARSLLEGVGRMLIYGIDPVQLPFLVGVSIARTNPSQVRDLARMVVDVAARAVVSDLAASLDIPTQDDPEENR